MRNRASRSLLALTAAVSGCAPDPGRLDAVHIVSPDGHTSFSARVTPTGKVLYRITHDGAAVIDWSPTGLVLAGDHGAPPAERLVSWSRGGGFDRRHYASLVLHVASNAGRRMDLEARAYDAGAAFRLVLPRQAGLDHAVIRFETTRFAFPRNALCLAVHQDAFSNSHEGAYRPVALDHLDRRGFYDLPLACQTGRSRQSVALSESGIETFSAAYFVRRRDGGLGVDIALTPHPDDPSIAVAAAIPADGLSTPWRVVMIADRPERLIASSLVDDLAAPSRIGDTAWIAPGKAIWAWWSGMMAPTIPHAGHDDATYRRYIDFAGRFGLRYYLIDRGWAYRGGSGNGTIADITRSASGVHVPRLVAYARRHHVGLWLWVNWKAIAPRMDEAMALYERVGIVGIKVDYLDRQDQAMVAFYHRLLATAAAHHLMVDIHAAFEPRGLRRTYPNFMTQEGVMGAEYNRWSGDVTANYNVGLAYSRAIIGPMDYSPGAFRNRTPANFTARHEAPEVATTRAQQLAMTVVYPSPLLVLADAPAAYLDAQGRPVPGFDFLRRVPTVWDETRGIAGAFGRWIAVARRRGPNWYVGVMNDGQARHVRLPLDFLHGRFAVERWGDGTKPDEIMRTRGTIGSRETIDLSLAPAGGAALLLTPMR